jgi:hypothetical protein
LPAIISTPTTFEDNEPVVLEIPPHPCANNNAVFTAKVDEFAATLGPWKTARHAELPPEGKTAVDVPVVYGLLDKSRSLTSPVFDVPSVIDCMPITGSVVPVAVTVMPASALYPGTIVPVYGW